MPQCTVTCKALSQAAKLAFPRETCLRQAHLKAAPLVTLTMQSNIQVGEELLTGYAVTRYTQVRFKKRRFSFFYCLSILKKNFDAVFIII